MADSSPGFSVYQKGATSSDTYEFIISKCRLWKIFDDVITALFFNILCWVSPGWDQISDFTDYLRNESRDVNKFVKGLKRIQMDNLRSPHPRETWDITLIYTLLQWAGILAARNDQKWSSTKGTDPERSMTALKDFRNEVAHSREITREQCNGMIRKIRKLTKKIHKGLRQIFRDVNNGYRKVHRTEIKKQFTCIIKEIDEIKCGVLGIEIFERYDNKIAFLKKRDFMKEQGLPSLHDYLRKFTCFSPVFQITKTLSTCKIPVENIFTEMILEDESEKKVPLQTILDHTPYEDTSILLLIKGQAGVGKTTLVKKIISDWLNKILFIRNLETFDLLLHVECRDHIESFKDLLVTSLGHVHQSFRDNELVDACLSLKCLLIIDGFDEINSSSSKLFQQILTLKKSYNLTVIITSRPESVEKLRDLVESNIITLVTIRLEGIPKEKTEEFVQKYYTRMNGKASSSQTIDGLLEYLKKTENKMSEVWRLPYNLSVITVLWKFRPDVVRSITTEAGLYWQIFILSISKLEERLQWNQLTSHLPLSVLKNRTREFLEHICWQALVGLRNDNIYLPPLAFQETSAFCYNLEVPVEELVGAFLKRVTTSTGSWYSFPHKGNQEFMAAYSICMQVTEQYCTTLKMEKYVDELRKTSIPKCIQSKMLDALKTKSEDKATVLTHIFENLHDGVFPDSLQKYQNMLIQVTSIFYVGQLEVPGEIKLEALKLLEASGLKDKESWLKVLHNLNCEDSTAKWIADRHSLFGENTTIKDFSVDSYIAIFRALESPLRDQEEIDIKIDFKQTPSSMMELASQINSHRIKVKELRLRDLFQGLPCTISASQENAIQILLKNCWKYVGMWSPYFLIPPTMKRLSVRLTDENRMADLLDALRAATQIMVVGISLSINIDGGIRPVPKCIPQVYIFITDIQDEKDVAKVDGIIRGFQPQDGRKTLKQVRFPRCSLSRERIHGLVDSISGISVSEYIALPEEIRPDSAACDKLSRKVKEMNGCLEDIE